MRASRAFTLVELLVVIAVVDAKVQRLLTSAMKNFRRCKLFWQRTLWNDRARGSSERPHFLGTISASGAPLTERPVTIDMPTA